MMRVLHVIDQLNVGGAEVLAINILNSLSKSDDYIVSLCVTRKEGPLKEDLNPTIDYNFLKKKSVYNLNFYFNFYKLIKRQNIKIIHAHNTSYFSCVLISFFLSVKIFRKTIPYFYQTRFQSL